MEWTLKRKFIIWAWVFMTLFEAGAAIWAFSIGFPFAGWIVIGFAVYLLIAGPGRWATMFIEDKRGWWLYEDL